MDICNDFQTVQVKMADRLHNLLTLYARKPADQRRVAKETMDFFIPWGEQHNMPEQWLTEMKRICSAILDKEIEA